MKLKLKNPVNGIDGNEIVEIEIKEPTGAMWLRHGDLEVAKIERGGAGETVTVETSMKALAGYLEECAGLPSPIVRSMHFKDLQAARAVLQGMFQAE
jgi:hypothetical protein